MVFNIAQYVLPLPEGLPNLRYWERCVNWAFWLNSLNFEIWRALLNWCVSEYYSDLRELFASALDGGFFASLTMVLFTLARRNSKLRQLNSPLSDPRRSRNHPSLKLWSRILKATHWPTSLKTTANQHLRELHDFLPEIRSFIERTCSDSRNHRKWFLNFGKFPPNSDNSSNPVLNAS